MDSFARLSPQCLAAPNACGRSKENDVIQKIEVSPLETGDAQGAQEWSCEAAYSILDDIRRTVLRDPDDAAAATSRLVSLLSLPSLQPADAHGGLAPWQKRKIDRFLKEHIAEPLRIERLAGQLSLSASYFHHAFKETFGVSPHVYITRLRLALVRTMMLATAEPLSQIAFACGFADQSHLCKIFRRELGEPPSIWRRRNVREKRTSGLSRAMRYDSSTDTRFATMT
jgi:AraC-like DNA-binding protein